MDMVGNHSWQLSPSLSFVSYIQDNAELINQLQVFGGQTYLQTVAICRGVFAPKKENNVS